MTDCQRPTGEACNCCNGEAIQHRLTEITQWIERLEWLITEIQNRPVGKDWQLTGCGGNALALNAQVATCAELDAVRNQIQEAKTLTDCAGRALTSAPSCDEFNALSQRVTDINNEITRITQMVDSLPRTPAPNPSPLPGVDQAVIDGIQGDIKTLKDQITDLTGRIEALESGGGNTGTGGACDFTTKWGVTAFLRKDGKDDDSFTVTVAVTGSPLKLATVMLPFHQRVVCLEETGTYTYQYGSLRTAGNYEAVRDGGVRLIHCGRNVAASDVQT